MAGGRSGADAGGCDHHRGAGERQAPRPRRSPESAGGGSGAFRRARKRSYSAVGGRQAGREDDLRAGQTREHGGSMKRLSVVGCQLSVLLLGGCGYALVGHNVSLDPKIKSVEVPALVNKTTRVGLEQIVTQSFADEMVCRGRLKLVRNANDADAILR